VRIWRLRLNEGELLLVIGCTDFTRHIPPKEYWKTKCPVIGVGHAVAAVDWPKDFTATASSSLTSKTVCSFVICIRCVTLSVRLRSFSSPPCFRALVKEVTSAPKPELSM
jgi:hypothetical protein